MLEITADFTMADIDKDIKQFLDDIEGDAIKALKGTVKKIVDKARAKTKAELGFNNITWNLRESIGGIVVKDHAIVETYFPPIGKGPEGHKNGLAYAQELALLLADDNQLVAVIVAGEFYVSFVEMKGWDVITGSFLMFEDIFGSLIKL